MSAAHTAVTRKTCAMLATAASVLAIVHVPDGGYWGGIVGRTRLLQDLASRIYLVKPWHPVRAAIDGVEAAGKAILAD